MELAALLLFTCVKKTEDNPTENTNVIFLILLAFFSDTSGWCVQRQSFKKKKRERERLTGDWTKPRCEYTSFKAKGHLKLAELSHVLPPPHPTQSQQGYKSPNCCHIVCELFRSFVSHICKVSAPVPEMNRNLVFTKPKCRK